MVSAIAASSFWVDEDGAGDLDGHRGAVHRYVQGVSDAGVAALDQCERERTSQLRAAVARRDMSEHRHRWWWQFAAVDVFDDLRALGKHGVGIGGQQPHELLAQ